MNAQGSNNHDCQELAGNSDVYQQMNDLKKKHDGIITQWSFIKKKKNNLRQNYRLLTCRVTWMNSRHSVVSKKETRCKNERKQDAI